MPAGHQLKVDCDPGAFRRGLDGYVSGRCSSSSRAEPLHEPDKAPREGNQPDVNEGPADGPFVAPVGADEVIADVEHQQGHDDCGD